MTTQRIIEGLKEAVEHAKGLSEPYTPRLICFADPPRIEYIQADVPAISRRVDDRMDLLVDVKSREPIGFRYYLDRMDTRELSEYMPIIPDPPQ